MKKAVIVDDERFCIEVLEELIAMHCPELEISGAAQSAAEGIAVIQQQSPDLVFLDIEMPVMSGFGMLEKLLPVPFAVIFTTAYDNHAIRAFKYSAMDYLLKPVDAEDLKAAVARFLNSRSGSNYAQQFDLLRENMRSLQTGYIQRIAIPTTEGFIMQPVKDILYCEASSSYTILQLINNTKIVSAKTLKDYEEMLEPHGFFRVHHSHLINMNYAERYVRGDGGMVVLTGGTEIAVSRSRKDAFLIRLQQT